MKIKDLQKHLSKLVKELEKSNFYDDAGEFIIENIKNRTRKGYGVSDNYKKKERIKVLSAPYKKVRQKLKRTGQLSSETTVNKSNLTQTGKMLDSLGYERVKSWFLKNRGVRIRPSQGENRDKARWVSDSGRPFLYLSRPEIKRLREKFDNHVEKIINKIFR